MAITSGVKDMQSVPNLVWDVLLPAMKAAPLRADPAGDAALKEALGHLVLTPVRGEVRFGGAEQRISCGQGEWRKGRVALGAFPEQPVAASGAWMAPDVYSARLVLYETPFSLTVRLRFAGDEVTNDSEHNVSFGPTKQPQITGKAE